MLSWALCTTRQHKVRINWNYITQDEIFTSQNGFSTSKFQEFFLHVIIGWKWIKHLTSTSVVMSCEINACSVYASQACLRAVFSWVHAHMISRNAKDTDMEKRCFHVMSLPKCQVYVVMLDVWSWGVGFPYFWGDYTIVNIKCPKKQCSFIFFSQNQNGLFDSNNIHDDMTWKKSEVRFAKKKKKVFKYWQHYDDMFFSGPSSINKALQLTVHGLWIDR